MGNQENDHIPDDVKTAFLNGVVFKKKSLSVNPEGFETGTSYSQYDAEQQCPANLLQEQMSRFCQLDEQWFPILRLIFSERHLRILLSKPAHHFELPRLVTRPAQPVLDAERLLAVTNPDTSSSQMLWGIVTQNPQMFDHAELL
ncbi:hypothetical protein Tco_1408151 [Tanacetum coccineum]